MRNTNYLSALILCCYFLLSSSFVENSATKEDGTYTVTIVIKNIRSTDGQLQFQIYKDHASFKREEPWKQKIIQKTKMKNHTLVYKLSGFKPGVYGFALLDDENRDRKMNYGLILPKEGYAFSDFFHSSMTKRPKFEDFKFSLDSDKTVSMVIRYMK